MTAGINGALAQSKRKFAQIRTLREQLDSQQQEQSDWTSSVGDNLDTAIGGVQGTTVTNVDNTVNIKVGNNGLFSPGGSISWPFRFAATTPTSMNAKMATCPDDRTYRTNRLAEE